MGFSLAYQWGGGAGGSRHQSYGKKARAAAAAQAAQAAAAHAAAQGDMMELTPRHDDDQGLQESLGRSWVGVGQPAGGGWAGPVAESERAGASTRLGEADGGVWGQETAARSLSVGDRGLHRGWQCALAGSGSGGGVQSASAAIIESSPRQSMLPTSAMHQPFSPAPPLSSTIPACHQNSAPGLLQRLPACLLTQPCALTASAGTTTLPALPYYASEAVWAMTAAAARDWGSTTLRCARSLMHLGWTPPPSGRLAALLISVPERTVGS